jgi:hypothetical protein
MLLIMIGVCVCCAPIALAIIHFRGWLAGIREIRSKRFLIESLERRLEHERDQRYLLEWKFHALLRHFDLTLVEPKGERYVVTRKGGPERCVDERS